MFQRIYLLKESKFIFRQITKPEAGSY
jgi:hypothetical protein